MRRSAARPIGRPYTGRRSPRNLPPRALAPVAFPSLAAKVNAYAPLLRRVRTCQRIRDHLPTLLAINFYKEGDVFRVVDTLNRVGG